MDINYDQLEVIHNTVKQQFEIPLGSQNALIVYTKQGSDYMILHTEVPKEHGGHGIADKMAKAALDTIRAEGVKVIPLCPFVKAYIDKHPEYAELVIEM